MVIKINDQKGNMTIWPEKLYTQQEVDDSYQEGKDSQIAKAKDIREADKSVNSQKKLDKNTVEGLVRKSNRILATISTYGFPFDLFPDTLNIEEGRITIIVRNFFSSSQVHSVDIKDISNIFINMAPFFAELVIASKTYERNIIKIKYLRKKDAIFIRRIIEGLRIFEDKQIDTSNYTKKGLIAKLEELSTTEIVT